MAHILSNNLNPNVVRTYLDGVFYPEFNGETAPGRAMANDPSIFRQESMEGASISEEVFFGTGFWDDREEEENVKKGNTGLGNLQTFVASEYSQEIDVSKWFFDDHKFGVVDRMVRSMAMSGRQTRERNAFDLYNNAFDSTTTGDGTALISDSRTTFNGDTIDNKLTSSLSEASLEEAKVMLEKQKNHSGIPMGHVAQTLLVPTELYNDAVKLTDSKLEPGTDQNDVNVFSYKYNIQVKTSPYLTDSNAWFLLSTNHSVTRYMRQPIETWLVDSKYSRNRNYIYGGAYREALGAVDYAGIVGSTGGA